MKKQRVIIIKNPRLRRVRNELRSLWKSWLDDIENSLWDEFWDTAGRGDSSEASRKLSELHLLETKSICTCIHCGRSDKDMIYTCDWEQWLCIECNSKRVYFNNLRNGLEMGKSELNEFLVRLEKSIKINHGGSKCNGYKNSKKILNKMGIAEEIQKNLYELLHYYGGHCDCDILINASLRMAEGNLI
ncbi:hypothetical protein LCGC14_1626400 [marine sediment metagenome]|uniref:DUF2695 domain-containing protein n=1 Tax=marine sediment metagenome TaxID=412755 RepID=A0A0F9L3Q0_9ZZZZ